MADSTSCGTQGRLPARRPAPIAKAPIWVDGKQKEIRYRAPTLGEHTDQIKAATAAENKWCDYRLRMRA